MGTVLGFTRVAPDELSRAFDDPQWYVECFDPNGRQLDVNLDKAWRPLQQLLNAAGIAVDLWDGGWPISNENDEWNIVNGWTVEDVRNAAQLLRAAPFEVLVRPHLASESALDDRSPLDDGELPYLRHHYENLVRFFEAAASDGTAAIMTTG